LARLSQFAIEARPAVSNIDLNPVAVLPAGKGAFILDAVIDINGAVAAGPTD
jgi:hypothetical protein